jgi:hypothetical protein
MLLLPCEGDIPRSFLLQLRERLPPHRQTANPFLGGDVLVQGCSLFAPTLPVLPVNCGRTSAACRVDSICFCGQ